MLHDDSFYLLMLVNISALELVSFFNIKELQYWKVYEKWKIGLEENAAKCKVMISIETQCNLVVGKWPCEVCKNKGLVVTQIFLDFWALGT